MLFQPCEAAAPRDLMGHDGAHVGKDAQPWTASAEREDGKTEHSPRRMHHMVIFAAK